MKLSYGTPSQSQSRVQTSNSTSVLRSTFFHSQTKMVQPSPGEVSVADDKFFTSTDFEAIKNDVNFTSKLPSLIEFINSKHKNLNPGLSGMIMQLAKYTQKLENIIRFKNKEIERLEYLNKYLVIAQSKRDEMLKHTLEENRKLKELSLRAERKPNQERKNFNKLSPLPTMGVGVTRTNTNSPRGKTLLLVHPVGNPEDVSSNHSLTKSPSMMLRSTKSFLPKQSMLFDDKKSQSILKLSDTDTWLTYQENEKLGFLVKYLNEDETFLNDVPNFDTATMMKLFESIQMVYTDHQNLLYIILKLKRLIKSATTMTTSLTLHESIEHVVDETCDCLDCERASVFMFDPEKGELWSKTAKGTDKTIRIPATMGIVGHVFNKGESLNIMDAYHDERFNKDNDVKSGFKTNTILCVPILDNANHAIGVVQAINKKGSAAVFSKDDEGLLMILATLAGAVLRNSLNYDDLKVFHNNLRSSLKIGIALTSCHGYNELIPTAEKKLKALMGGEQSRIILKNADNDDLYTYKEGEIERFPAKCGIAGYAISTGEMQNIANAYTHNLFNGGIDIQTSMPLICQPFKHPGTDQIMGAFEVINVRGIPGLSMSQKPKITHYDIETLDFFSKQLAQAITNTVRWEKLVKTGKDDSCVQPAKIPDSPLHITKPL